MTYLVQNAVREAISQARSTRRDRMILGEEVALLDSVTRECWARLHSIRGAAGTNQSRAAIALYVTMLDLGRAISVCANNTCSIAVPTLARQLLDAFVDLKNVCESASYIEHLDLKDTLVWKAALEEASAGKNAYLRNFHESPHLATWRSERVKHVETAAKKGVRQLPIETRFKRAGMSDEYHSVWNILSAHVHNGTSALSGRHFDISAHGAITIQSSEGRTPYEMPAITHAVELLIVASEVMQGKYGNPPADFSDVRSQYVALSNRILAGRRE